MVGADEKSAVNRLQERLQRVRKREWALRDRCADLRNQLNGSNYRAESFRLKAEVIKQNNDGLQAELHRARSDNVRLLEQVRQLEQQICSLGGRASELERQNSRLRGELDAARDVADIELRQRLHEIEVLLEESLFDHASAARSIEKSRQRQESLLNQIRGG